MERVLGHLRGNVIAYLALFVALGGTAYAAAKLEKNSVKSKQIRDGQVKAVDLGANSVTAPKVANGSLLSEDFKAGELPAGETGPQGIQGPAGQDATKLFAYIRDNGIDPAFAASVGYGSGVTGVADAAGGSAYTVTFNRSLQNCVVDAIAGFGDPAPSPASYNGVVQPSVNLTAGTASQVEVGFSETGPLIDTSFMITAFC